MLTIANRAVSRGTSGRPVSIPSAVIAEVDTIKVVESGTIGVEQLTSPWTVSGTVTASPSGTQDVNVVGDTVNLMKSTSGTIAEVTAVGSTVDVNIVAQAHVPLTIQLYSGTNVAGTMDARATQVTSPWVTRSDVSSTANVLQRTIPWESRLYAGTNLAGSITALQGTDPWTVSGTVTASPSGTQDVNVVGDTVNLMKSTGGTLTSIPSGTQDIDIIAQSYKPLDVQIHSGTNVAGTVDARCTQTTIPWDTELHSGTNNVGYVGVYGGTLSLTDRANQVVLRSGTNNVGYVGIYGGTLDITSRSARSLGQISAGTNNMGYVGVYGGTLSLTDRANQVVLRSGTNNVGYVGIYGGTITPSGTQDVSMVGLVNPTTSTVTMSSTNTAYLLPGSELANRKALIIYSPSTADVFIGDSGVTTTIGIQLPASGKMSVDCHSGLYGVASTAVTLNILEFS